MSSLNFKQLWVSAALISGLLILGQILSGLFRPDVNVKDIDVPALTTPERPDRVSETDFTPLFARYELLQPEPELKNVADENAGQKETEESTAAKAIKELKPNFYALNEEYQIGLVAVFEQPDKFAVLQLVNYQNGQSEFKKLSLGNTVGSYQLSKINRLSVLLSNQNSQIELSMFKPKT